MKVSEYLKINLIRVLSCNPIDPHASCEVAGRLAETAQEVGSDLIYWRFQRCNPARTNGNSRNSQGTDQHSGCFLLLPGHFVLISMLSCLSLLNSRNSQFVRGQFQVAMVLKSSKWNSSL